MTAPVAPGARIYADDTNDLGDASARRPVARLTCNAPQSIPNNVVAGTAILFPTEDYDTHGGHDLVTNNSRWIVPAGFDGTYDIRGTVFHGARADYQIIDAWIRKNGATNIAPSGRRGPMGTTTAQANAVQTFARIALVAGDYIELMAMQINTAALAVNTNQSGQFSSVLEIALDRL